MALPLAALLLSWSGLGWSAEPAHTAPQFQTSDRCMACHTGFSSPSGEDSSFGFDWRASMMANSSRDPYWQASVRREVTDHPESRAAIEDECSTCHMPMARFESKQRGREGEVFAHLPFDSGKPDDRLAADGVSCSLCHQIGQGKLGTRESFAGGFVIDPANSKGEREVYGRFKIEAGQTGIMRTSTGGFRPTESEHIRKSEMCATCHTLYTKARGPKGDVIGELPEQVPYQEWLHSEFREKQSCQSCHMPAVKEDAPITRVLGKPREGVSRHVFVGGNFFMLRMLNRFRDELSVQALPQELASAAERTVAFLQTQTARIAIEKVDLRAGRLVADISVENLGGHKLPTAYPSRRAWLHVVVRDRNRRVVFESGAVDAKGQIQGNDNDADPARFEPHYAEITASDQVQIYESVMADASGAVTTGLLSAVRYLKDNRLLPRGFDKKTAGPDIAVQGSAAEDSDFVDAGDRVRYLVAIGNREGPFQIEAELWFQPVSFRWAENLRKYDTSEPRRFNSYYDSMASSSALMLVRTSATKSHSMRNGPMPIREKWRHEVKMFSEVVRRTHMYAALFLVPWMLMYALRTIVMNHRARFQEWYRGALVNAQPRRADIEDTLHDDRLHCISEPSLLIPGMKPPGHLKPRDFQLLLRLVSGNLHLRVTKGWVIPPQNSRPEPNSKD